MDSGAVPIKKSGLGGGTGVDEILPHLYLSNRFQASSKNMLEAYDIKTVLTIMEYPIADNKKVSGVIYEFLEMDDECSMDILSLMPTFNRLIYDGLARGNVLVHCLAGVSRSVTAIASYLIATLDFTARQAQEIIREGRPRAGPNEGFYNQLTVFEKRKQGAKQGTSLTDDAQAFQHVQQILAESEKYANFKFATRVLLQKQESGYKVESAHEQFALHCKQCGTELLQWDDIMIHDPTAGIPINLEERPCSSYFTVKDTRVVAKHTLKFYVNAESQESTNPFDKSLKCVECNAELGECDAWYGVKCACNTLVLPGYQILKETVERKDATTGQL